MKGKMGKKGPSEMKGQGGKTHPGVKGPSEMHAGGAHGPKHKGVKGPGEMKDAGLKGGDGTPMSKAHEAEHVGGDMHKHLGEHAEMGVLKDGHRKLEKVSADSLGGDKYGKGHMSKDGGGDGNDSEY
jgi:hypothetical protein